jgi:hypothetical protein
MTLRSFLLGSSPIKRRWNPGFSEEDFRADVEVAGKLFDVTGREMAFAAEDAVAQADVGAEEAGEVAGVQIVFGEEELEGFQARTAGDFHRLFFVGFDQLGEGFEVIVLIRRPDGKHGEDIDDFLRRRQLGIVVNLARHEQPAKLAVGFGQAGRFAAFDFGAAFQSSTFTMRFVPLTPRQSQRIKRLASLRQHIVA